MFIRIPSGGLLLGRVLWNSRGEVEPGVGLSRLSIVLFDHIHRRCIVLKLGINYRVVNRRHCPS